MTRATWSVWNWSQCRTGRLHWGGPRSSKWADGIRWFWVVPVGGASADCPRPADVFWGRLSYLVSIYTPLGRRHFLQSVGELAVVSVFASACSPCPGGCAAAALGPPPFWRVSCLYCSKARLTASSTNRLLTLSSSASSGSDRRRPPVAMRRQKRMFIFYG